MAPLLCLLLAAAPSDSIAPLGPGQAAQGAHADVVLRPLGQLAAGRPALVKVLVSDAATDAPLEGASVSLRIFGPPGSGEVDADAQSGAHPGHYLARLTPASPGSEAFVAAVDGDLAAGEGLEVAAPAAPGRRKLPWPFGVLLAALGLAVVCLAAGDARAHGVYVPPPAAVPGADEYLAQEIQFALGLRTAPGQVEAFDPPGGGAPRRFLAVPETALVERDGKKLLFVRLAPERFVAREPKLGWAQAGRVAVLSGVELDEKVVVAGAAFLRNGGATRP